jgi:hypothetical protein
MFVTDEKIACYQTREGEIAALPYQQFLDWRKGLEEPARAELNVIWIAGKMGFRRQRLVMDALMQIEARRGSGESTPAADRGADQGLRFGAHQIALLHHNILSWEGPKFAGVPCTQSNIDRLDPDEDLVAFTLAEIGRRNPVKKSPDPKSAGASGSSAAGAASSTVA